MKIKQYAAFALMGLALGACQKPGGEDPDVVEPEGKLVKTKLAISIPKSIRTYAPGADDPYATADEVKATRIDVFVYENGGSYSVDHFYFDNANDPLSGDHDFRINEDDDVFETNTFQVREGDKLVYVGINLPTLIRDRLATGYYVNEIFEDSDLLNRLIAPNPDNPSTNGSALVPFFSSGRGVNVKFDDVQDDDATKTLPVTVNRLVSKIIVTTKGGAESTAFNDVSGGTLTNFEFAIGQVNNQMFVAPLIGLLGNDSDPGQDPNHYQVGSGDRVGANTTQEVPVFRPIDMPNDYKPINDDDAIDFTNPDTYVHYATENTSEYHRHQDVTYVSVRAQFVPHKLGGDPTSGDAGEDNPDNLPPTSPNHFLYAVFTGDDSGEGSSALGARYFYDIEDARDFVMGNYFQQKVLGGGGTTVNRNTDTDYVPDAESNDSDFYIFAYEDSWCYYRIYLNPRGLAKTGGTPDETNRYDVLRNTVYIARISGVNYIGTTNPVAIPGGLENGTLSETDVTSGSGLANLRGTPIYPGAWFPKLLPNTPIYPEDEITETPFATGLSVEMEVEDWYEHDDEYELN